MPTIVLRIFLIVTQSILITIHYTHYSEETRTQVKYFT